MMKWRVLFFAAAVAAPIFFAASSADTSCEYKGVRHINGATWYDDHRCVKFDCNVYGGQSYLLETSCPAVAVTGVCHTVRGSGHYPACCPRCQEQGRKAKARKGRSPSWDDSDDGWQNNGYSFQYSPAVGLLLTKRVKRSPSWDQSSEEATSRPNNFDYRPENHGRRRMKRSPSWDQSSEEATSRPNNFDYRPENHGKKRMKRSPSWDQSSEEATSRPNNFDFRPENHGKKRMKRSPSWDQSSEEATPSPYSFDIRHG